VDVRSDRRYRFEIEPEELWPLMVQVEAYRRWWPWLRACDATAFETGEQWTCVVQPPLPYSLRFRVTLDEIDPGRFVAATIDGDITGTARIDVTAADAGSELRLVSRLAPHNGLLRAISAVARPIAQLGHDWVIDTGLRQFRAEALPDAAG
jgi:uncharacterized protein YndB with AHSA1/START domain